MYDMKIVSRIFWGKILYIYMSHPVVSNSKLTEEEKNKLDSPLSVDELDKSVDK
jgi:hypothetical protein